jgi:hypothetical protein
MTTDNRDPYVKQHLLEVGLVCTQWAYLEWLFEVTQWWILNLLDHPTEGRLLTGGLNLETLSRRVCDLSHLTIKDEADRAELQKLKDRVIAIKDERDLAVHGVRSIKPGHDVTGTVARGTYKAKPQELSPIRLSSLNRELTAIIKAMTALVVRLRILEDTDELAAKIAQQQAP